MNRCSRRSPCCSSSRSEAGVSDPVGRYSPEYPNQDVAAKVTVRHLLTHTGGTGDIFGQNSQRTGWLCGS